MLHMSRDIAWTYHAVHMGEAGGSGLTSTLAFRKPRLPDGSSGCMRLGR
jgi:hypothetical protein